MLIKIPKPPTCNKKAIGMYISHTQQYNAHHAKQMTNLVRPRQCLDVTDAGAAYTGMFNKNVRFNLLICADRRNYRAIKNDGDRSGGSGGVEKARLEINCNTNVSQKIVIYSSTSKNKI